LKVEIFVSLENLIVFGCLENVTREKHTNMLKYLKVEQGIFFPRNFVTGFFMMIR